MPGSGKTTLGRKLASRLRYLFIDGDDLIISTGRSLQQIINDHGEKEFLRIESEVLSKLQGKRMVIAPGGSCVMSHHAMQHLRDISLVVFINVPLNVLALRLVDAPQRGIIGLERHSLEELYYDPKAALCTLRSYHGSLSTPRFRPRYFLEHPGADF
jgi:shikimate kinase